MKREIIATGADIREAQANAAELLGAGLEDNIVYEVIEFPKKGFLGLGNKLAKVKATVEVPDQEIPERRPAKKAAKAEIPQKAPKPAQKREAMKPDEEVVLTPLSPADGEDLSFEFVKTVIANLGLDATASLYSQDEGGRRICVEGADASLLIGHHGETLDALQYLSNLACAKKNVNGEKITDHVTVDIEGYRAKREKTLRALARRMAAKAVKSGKNVSLEPMNAYERRIIHSEIQGIEGVTTSSVGADNNRRVVIYVDGTVSQSDDEV